MLLRFAKNVLATSVYVCAPALVAAALADAAGASTSIAASTSIGPRLLLVLKLTGYMLPSLVVVGLFIALAVSVLGRVSAGVQQQRLVVLDDELVRSDVVNATTLALIACFAIAAGLGVYLTRHFSNLDIVSFALAAGTVLLVQIG